MLSDCHHLPGCNLPSLKVSERERKKRYHFPPWTLIPLRATFDLLFIWFPGEHMPSLSQHVTLLLHLFTSVFLFYSFNPLPFFFVSQWSRRPVANLVLRGDPLPVSSAGGWVCCVGGVHSRRVSHRHGKRCSITVGFVCTKHLETCLSLVIVMKNCLSAQSCSCFEEVWGTLCLWELACLKLTW